MKSFIKLNNTKQDALPPQFSDADDVRYTREFAETFIREHSKEGDVVFDPFCGFGTTLVAAEVLKRKPAGIEYDDKKVKYIRSVMTNKDAIIQGDARKLSSYDLPKFDLCLTSPPYMGKGDKENPFTSYRDAGDGYDAYLADVSSIYKQIRALANDNAKVIVELSNIKNLGEVTTLAWDVCNSVSRHFHFDGEVVVGWDPTYGYGYDHSYCLVFSV